MRQAVPRARRPSGEAPSTDPDAAREAALKLLERMRRTRSDLHARLLQKGFAEGTTAEVLDRLAEVGLLDDVEYARAFLAGRWNRRTAGRRRLEEELRRRGVSAPDFARARTEVEERLGAMDEVASAHRVITQSARRYARLDPRVRRQRLYALLARRGFDGDVIRRALEIPEEGGAEDS
jgi:regulatory protein